KTQKDANLESHLQEARQHLAEEKIYVVVCGEFKQGKSSLINAFIDETHLFPVDVKITTNLVSTIAYAEQEEITVILGDIGQGQAKQINRSEIAEYVTEQKNKGNQKKAKLLMIESPNPHLKDGLVLVDTPGTGSLNAEHTALTYSFIPNADAILFVSDIQSPLKVEDLNFIKERILPHCQNIIFVLTKIDAITNSQKIIDSNREKLSNSLNLSPEQISLIPVSSKAKQEYLKYKDPEDLEESHFLQLQEKIWSLVKEKRGQILLLKALTELGKALTQIKRPLEVEWQSYQQRSQQELDQWEQDIKKIQKQLQDLLQNNAEWHTHLRDGLEVLRLDAQNEFHNGFVQLQRRSTKYLDDPAFLKNPQQIPTLLESDIDAMMTELSKKLNSKAATLYGEIEERSGLNFNPFAATSLEPEHAHFALDEIQIKKSSVDEKALTFGRSGLSNMSGLGFAGSLVGGIIGGLIGTFLSPGVGTVGGAQLGAAIGGGLGALAGTTRGVIEGVQQVAKQDQTLAKQEISKILRQYLEDSQRLCMQTLNQSIKSLEKFMRDELTSQIKRQKESYDKTLQSLQQARKLSQEQGS
ncbi:MAG: dynamin family protein, partial [Microcystis panniformis]